MTPSQFLELIVPVSLQVAIVVAATHWIGRLVEGERLRCRLWSGCYGLLPLLVINRSIQAEKFLRTCHRVDANVISLCQIELTFSQRSSDETIRESADSR